MKIITVLGTRPEIIRLSRVIPKLDALCEHVVVHTGQNFDRRLSDVFLEEMGIRQPDHYLGIRGGAGEQIGRILAECEAIFQRECPDRLLLLGDTNSALCALVAKRLGIPVFHMEAGNRCYDDRVPEEVNRRVIDHCSDVLMPYTERSRQNLLREGIVSDQVFVVGNPIYEVIRHYEPQIVRSRILDDLRLGSGGYFLVTMHRAENVDVEPRLRALVDALDRLQREHGIPVIVSTHPRTRERLGTLDIVSGENSPVRFLDPFGFFDFITLERNAKLVLSDSGTVQEECAIFGVRNITIRDVTERPETIECGSNILSGVTMDGVSVAVRAALQSGNDWPPPAGYVAEGVSETVVKIVLGRHRALDWLQR
jgi:UDP-N-acetylglucosamine 2-epimerase (non-hydrolysing)